MLLRLRTMAAAGLAFCVLGVCSASPASAEFHSSVGHAILDGTPTTSNIFTFHWGATICSKLTYSGTQSAKSPSQITLSPAYSGCSVWPFGGVTIDTNGCYFLFQASQVDLVCPVAPMEITLPGCETTIGSQSLTGVAYATQGVTPKRDVRVQFNLTKIKYSHPETAAACSGTYTNGTYQGTVTVTGTDSLGSQVDFWTS